MQLIITRLLVGNNRRTVKTTFSHLAVIVSTVCIMISKLCVRCAFIPYFFVGIYILSSLLRSCNGSITSVLGTAALEQNVLKQINRSILSFSCGFYLPCLSLLYCSLSKDRTEILCHFTVTYEGQSRVHKAIKPDCKFFYEAVFFTFQHFICSPTVSTD